MSDTLAFVLEYGYLILYGCVLAEQIGLPIPGSWRGRLGAQRSLGQGSGFGGEW